MINCSAMQQALKNSYKQHVANNVPKLPCFVFTILFFNRTFKDTVNKFFLGEGEFGNDVRWNTRSRRLHSKSLGVKVKETPTPNLSVDTLDAPDSVFDASFRSVSRRLPHPIDPLARRTGRHDSTGSSFTYGYGRQYSRQV